MLALLLAMLLALATAVPGLAAEEPAGGDGEIQPQVVGGDPLPGGKYPFVAALLDKTWPGSDCFGAGCGARNFPGVYTEVNNQNIREFIVSAADL